jgi:hypothetical protein
MSLRGAGGRSLLRPQIVAVLSGVVLVVGCGGSQSQLGPNPSPEGSTGNTGHEAGPDSMGTTSNESGATTEAGAETSVPLTVQIGPPAPPGQDLVVSGVVSTSPSYKLFSTVGEGPGGNGVMSSPQHKLIGGLLGTTQH